VAVVNVWRASTEGPGFSIELAAGFIVFPIALNLLAADAVHDSSVETFGG
jgi:hypothetical protein